MANYKLTQRTNTKGEKINCVIADFKNMTENEKEAVKMYVEVGYKLFPKEEKKKAGNGITKEVIKKDLEENNKEALNKFNKALRDKKNFMKIVSWYKKGCEGEIE